VLERYTEKMQNTDIQYSYSTSISNIKVLIIYIWGVQDIKRLVLLGQRSYGKVYKVKIRAQVKSPS